MKSPIVDPDKMFPEVERMLYRQAWRYSRSFRIPFSLAQSQASFAFVKACYTYKPEKASFLTWCYFKVTMSLKDAVIERTKDRLLCLVDVNYMMDGRGDGEPRNPSFLETVMESNPDIYVPEDGREFLEKLEDKTQSLSPHAEQFLSLLMDTPPELIEGKRPTAKQLSIRIKRRMVDEGIGRAEVERAFTELGDSLTTIWT